MNAKTVTTTEAARRLNCTRQNIHYLLTQGRIVGELIGRMWFVHPASLEHVKRLKPGPQPKGRKRGYRQ